MLEELRRVDPDRLTPLEALALLAELRKRLSRELDFLPCHCDRDPLQELLELQERINRLFEETLGRDRLDEPQGMHGAWVPAADVFETADCYVVELELPGVAKDEVDGARPGQRARGARRAAGLPAARARTLPPPGAPPRPLRRSFRFSGRDRRHGVGAELTDGLLRLRVPKPHARAPRRVPVERSAKD